MWQRPYSKIQSNSCEKSENKTAGGKLKETVLQIVKDIMNSHYTEEPHDNGRKIYERSHPSGEKSVPALGGADWVCDCL